MPNPKSVVLALATTVHPGDYFFYFCFSMHMAWIRARGRLIWVLNKKKEELAQ
jgi:hypothetical protein